MEAVEAGLAQQPGRGGQPLVVYTVARGHPDRGGSDPTWGKDDLDLDSLSISERYTIQGIVEKLRLGKQDPVDPRYDPHDACGRLAHWFATDFTYQTYQDVPNDQGEPSERSPLLRFLTRSYAGHCEYFATATVLLLRAAGIPARYAVGWSVSERDGGRYLARARDAHAWTLVWDRQAMRWNDFDTTPASWLAEESRPRSWLAALRDLGDEAWYRFALWRQEGGRWQLAVFIAGMAVLGWIGWRQLRGSAWRRARRGAPAQAQATILGLDSELAPLLPRIAVLHGERLPHETVRAWLGRLRLLGSGQAPGLDEALNLHLRLRFDPAGLPDAERQALRALVVRLAPALGAGAGARPASAGQ